MIHPLTSVVNVFPKSRAGYAGGTKLGKDTNKPGSEGIVCYHNMLNVADYGSLGHGEVSSVSFDANH
jgi:hypothetical protein